MNSEELFNNIYNLKSALKNIYTIVEEFSKDPEFKAEIKVDNRNFIFFNPKASTEFLNRKSQHKLFYRSFMLKIILPQIITIINNQHNKDISDSGYSHLMRSLSPFFDLSDYVKLINKISQ